MKRGKTVILLMTILFAALAVVFGRNEIGMRNFPFSVIVTSDDGTEELHCMKLGGEYYLFLPSYAEEAETRVCSNLIYDVVLDGKPLENNQPFAGFPTGIPLELSFRSLGNAGQETLTLVRSADVATLYLEVPSGDMEYIHEKKGNTEAGTVRLYTADGTLDYTGSAESIKGRGNATWEDTEKKSYSLKLFGEADLLGMGTAQNWVLLSNAWDSSNIRNKVAYDTAAAAGMAFTPESNWVDLYLNGEYAGVYLLSERNEVHPQRVDIPYDAGFLVSLEFPYRLVEQNYPFVSTDKGLALRIHDSSVGNGELEMLWQSVENAILAEDGVDPISGKYWQDLIDLDSWAHKYLLEELFANYDAGSISQYFYCDLSKPEAKIMAGPIWDFDNSMGRGGWITSNPQSVMAARAHFFDVDDAPLFYGLYQKEAFYNRVVELFATVYEPLLTELVDSGLQAYADRVAAASEADQLRWSSGDYRKATDDIEAFLRRRLEFAHDLWVNQTEYCAVEISSDAVLWACWMVPKGGFLPELPVREGYRWCNAVTGEPFDITQPVQADVHIREFPQ